MTKNDRLMNFIIAGYNNHPMEQTDSLSEKMAYLAGMEMNKRGFTLPVTVRRTKGKSLYIETAASELSVRFDHTGTQILEFDRLFA